MNFSDYQTKSRKTEGYDVCYSFIELLELK